MVHVRGYSEDEVDFLADVLSEKILAALYDVAGRTADQLQPAVTASSSAGVGPEDVAVLTTLWAEQVDDVILPYVGQVYVGSAVTVAVGLADGFPDVALPGIPAISDDFTQTFLKTVSGNFVSIGDDVFEDVREVVVQGVKRGESIEQIAAKMRYVTEFSKTRAVEIARTVTHSAAESGSIAQMRFVGYSDENTIKEWVSAHDARVRPSHSHADNQRVPLNQSFTVGAATLDFPGDPSGPSAEIRQCRCTMFFDVDEVPKFRCAGALTAAVRTFHLDHNQKTHGRKASAAAWDETHASAQGELTPFKRVPMGYGTYSDYDTGEIHEFETTPELRGALERYFAGSRVNDSLRKRKGKPSAKDSTGGGQYERNPDYPIGHPKAYTEVSPGSDAKVDTDIIDSAMDSSVTTGDLVTYRGVESGSDTFGDSWRSDSSMEGTTFHDFAYTSTSGSVETAVDYTGEGGVLMRYAVPQGSRALGLSVDAGGGEGEIILPRGSTVRVVRDNGVDETWGVRVLDVVIE